MLDEFHNLITEEASYFGELSDTMKKAGDNIEEYSVVFDGVTDLLKKTIGQIPAPIYAANKKLFESAIIIFERCSDIKFLAENISTIVDLLWLLKEKLINIDLEISTRAKTCCCCGNKVVYLPLSKYYTDMRKQYGVIEEPISETLNADEYECPSCHASDRDRMMIQFMKQNHIEEAEEGFSVLQIAPSQSIHTWLRTYCPHLTYHTSDLFMKGVTYQSDIQDLKEIEDESYDVIICSHVLEHVKDDMLALQAMKRVLKPSGIIIFLVPLDLSVKVTDEEWGCSEAENWRRFGQGDHCRNYAKSDLLKRLNTYFYTTECGAEYFGEHAVSECALTATSTLYILTKSPDVSFDMGKEWTVDADLIENGPRVSVVLSAYNHEKYIAKSIESVLNQTYKNIEFLVADDASSDSTPDIIKSYEGRLAKALCFDKNKGERNSDLKQYITGKYVALMHSDDFWEPEKIAIQVQYMEEHPECGICLTWADYVDEDGKRDGDPVFINGNIPETAWVRFMWEHGNRLCNPSFLARREYFYEELPYGNAGRQRPDMFHWIGMMQKTHIHIITKVLTYMTRHINECENDNMSAQTYHNIARTMVELGCSWMWVLMYMEDDFFKKAFSDLLINKNPVTEEEIMMEKYFIMLNSPYTSVQNAALTYFTFIYERVKDMMVEEYGYTRKNFWDDESSKGFAKYYEQAYEKKFGERGAREI